MILKCHFEGVFYPEYLWSHKEWNSYAARANLACSIDSVNIFNLPSQSRGESPLVHSFPKITLHDFLCSTESASFLVPFNVHWDLFSWKVVKMKRSNHGNRPIVCNWCQCSNEHSIRFGLGVECRFCAFPLFFSYFVYVVLFCMCEIIANKCN